MDVLELPVMRERSKLRDHIKHRGDHIMVGNTACSGPC